MAACESARRATQLGTASAANKRSCDARRAARLLSHRSWASRQVPLVRSRDAASVPVRCRNASQEGRRAGSGRAGGGRAGGAAVRQRHLLLPRRLQIQCATTQPRTAGRLLLPLLLLLTPLCSLRAAGDWVIQDGTKFRHGHGVFVNGAAEGNTYEGEWNNDKMHGRGTFVYASKAKYEARASVIRWVSSSGGRC